MITGPGHPPILSPPPGSFEPGQRQGTYRTGTGYPVVDDRGVPSISYEDYVLALIDECELRRHLDTGLPSAIDCRWTVDDPAASAYRRGHSPRVTGVSPDPYKHAQCRATG